MTWILHHPFQNSYRARERSVCSKDSAHLRGIECVHIWHILRNTQVPHDCGKLGVASDTCYPRIGEDQNFKVILSYLARLRPAWGHLALCLKQTKPKQNSEEGERKERLETRLALELSQGSSPPTVPG